jgi:hypothetical protein
MITEQDIKSASLPKLLAMIEWFDNVRNEDILHAANELEYTHRLNVTGSKPE